MKPRPNEDIIQDLKYMVNDVADVLREPRPYKEEDEKEKNPEPRAGQVWKFSHLIVIITEDENGLVDDECYSFKNTDEILRNSSYLGKVSDVFCRLPSKEELANLIHSLAPLPPLNIIGTGKLVDAILSYLKGERDE